MWFPSPYSEPVRWWERVGAWGDTHRFALDATGTALLCLVVVPLSTTTSSAGRSAGGWAAALLVPLAWRRTRPAASAAAVFAVALSQLLLGPELIVPADLAVLVALYSVTVHGPRWAYWTAISGAMVGAAALGGARGLRAGAPGLLDAAVSVAAVALLSVSVFAIGLVRRSRHQVVDSLVDRARRLEVERNQLAVIAVAAERTRIAREMHDIVAHSLSVIIAQADGGRYAAQAEPDAAVRSLATIAETGRAALTDMRQLLGVLRPPEPGGEVAPGSATRADLARRAGTAAPAAPGDLVPQPAVADLNRLVEQVRDSGLEVSVVRVGTERPLPPGTGLTVYRICQECLTNVLKHGGPGVRASVLLQWSARSLVLEVTDDGRGAAAQSDGGGHGVLGMRERATMLGGTLAIGPRPGGGFRVRAEIPLPPAASTTATDPTGPWEGR